MPDTYLIYFDFETGGVEDHHPNIQIAAIAVSEQTGKEVDSFERKIKFDIAKADPKALEINHYSELAWGNADPEPRVWSYFVQWSKPYHTIEMKSKAKGTKYHVGKLAGHNALAFDLPRLRRMCGPSFFPFTYQVLDTMQRALWFFQDHPEVVRPANLKLTTLAEWLGIPPDGAHDALTDVRLSHAIAQGFRRKEQECLQLNSQASI